MKENLGWLGIGMVLLTRFEKRRKQVHIPPAVQTPPVVQPEQQPEATPEA